MISLPWPPASLSGHNNGHWRTKQALVKKHRQWAHDATLAAKETVPGAGDILVHVRFIPPDRRSDRVNFANRMKPYFDGIADALGVNDVRFLPSYEFCAPEKPGRIEVELRTLQNGENQVMWAGRGDGLQRLDPALSQRRNGGA